MSRRPNARAVKRHRNYTVDEAARTLDVAKGTVRRWSKAGLPVLDQQRPTLITGHSLIAFLRERKPKAAKLAIHQGYCFSCRGPRDPAFGEVEIVGMTRTSGMMRALCEVCTTVMHKRVSARSLDALRAKVTIANEQDHERINEGDRPCSNDHLKRGE